MNKSKKGFLITSGILSIIFFSSALSDFIFMDFKDPSAWIIYSFALGIASLILGIIMLVKAKKGNGKLTSVITLMVINFIAFGFLSFVSAGFLIAVMCLTDKSKNEETNNNTL